jgi:hypothetical protein
MIETSVKAVLDSPKTIVCGPAHSCKFAPNIQSEISYLVAVLLEGFWAVLSTESDAADEHFWDLT